MIIDNEKDYFNFSNNNFLMLTTNSNNSLNLNKILSNMNLDINSLCSVNQIHSDKVIFANKAGNYGNADGLLTQIENKLILTISTADCIPIFLYDEILGVYGLLHAGWRGVVNKIHLNAIDELSKIGSKIENINIFLGPFIKECCFEIKDDIIDNFDRTFIIIKNNRKYVNLLGLVISELISKGLNENNIKYSSICTYEDDRCHSYRKDFTSKRMYSIMVAK